MKDRLGWGRSGGADFKPLVGAVALLAALWSPACGGIVDISGGAGAGGSSDSPGIGGRTSVGNTGAAGPGAGAAGPTPGAGGSYPVGDAVRGATVYFDQCASCHGADAAGSQGPNLTFSKTAGIGTWTYQQFHDAVRFTKAPDGSSLCIFMVAFAVQDVSEQSLQDIYTFLRTRPIVDKVNRGTYCP